MKFVFSLKFCENPDLPQYLTWTIHGLWPETVALNPTVRPWNFEQIKPLLPELEKYWETDYIRKPGDPEYVLLSDEEFWSHEYKKHATRAWDRCDTYDYFYKALMLYKFHIRELDQIRPSHPHQEYRFHYNGSTVEFQELTR